MLNSTQLYFQRNSEQYAVVKKAKISHVCLTGRQGRHSALTDTQKIV